MIAARSLVREPVVLDARIVTGTGGGPEKTILNSPRFLNRDGYRMLCAYLHPPGDSGFEQLRERAARLGAPLLPVPDRGALDWRIVPQLLNICRRERVAIWHGHDYKSNALGLLLRRFWPMRLVTTVHGWVEHTRRTGLYYRIDRFCLPRYERVICVSDDLRRESLAAGVPESRCLLLENGIDTDDYRRRQTIAEAKSRLGLRTDRLTIGAVGRLSPEKGFDLLIRAAARLIASGHDLELLIAGQGSEKEPLTQLAAELGCADRVRLLGYVADPRTLYEALDVYALSSLREGLPNVLLEAMALEVPVVATRIAGVPRLVSHQENGLLIEPRSVEALTASLDEMLSHADLRARLAHAGRETVETRYSFARRMRRIRELYDGMLAV